MLEDTEDNGLSGVRSSEAEKEEESTPEEVLEVANNSIFPPSAYALGPEVIKERLAGIKGDKGKLGGQGSILKKIESLKPGGSRLKSSSPPLTPEKLAPEIKQHKDLINYMEEHGDLPSDFPLCTYDDTMIGDKVQQKLWPGRVRYTGPCAEHAHWVVQIDFNDPSSPVALLCTKHFTQLPVQPSAGLYRVFKLHVRNYSRWIRKDR